MAEEPDSIGLGKHYSPLVDLAKLRLNDLFRSQRGYLESKHGMLVFQA